MAPTGTAGDAWAIDDVFLLTDGDEGRVAIPHLMLTFGTPGIELAKDDGQLVWQCAWTDLNEFSTAERSLLADGREGVVLVVSERTGRHHRFVLPSVDPDQTEATMRDVAARHALRTSDPARAVSPWLTALIALAGVATVAALVLTATHVIHL
ncbi:MAG TPA: hypothetical protein VHV57_17185 [Acidimicrobiales bacterium]|jgi:hypothetical protein|nr:hypothetical protein [Acidimicrobiales bacterium]